jgi:hypothetical protein
LTAGEECFLSSLRNHFSANETGKVRIGGLIFYQGRGFEDFGEGAEAHDPGLDLIRGGDFERQFQRFILELSGSGASGG